MLNLLHTLIQPFSCCRSDIGLQPLNVTVTLSLRCDRDALPSEAQQQQQQVAVQAAGLVRCHAHLLPSRDPGRAPVPARHLGRLPAARVLLGGDAKQPRRHAAVQIHSLPTGEIRK